MDWQTFREILKLVYIFSFNLVAEESRKGVGENKLSHAVVIPIVQAISAQTS